MFFFRKIIVVACVACCAMLPCGVTVAATDAAAEATVTSPVSSVDLLSLKGQVKSGKHARNAEHFEQAITLCRQGLASLGDVYLYPGLADDAAQLASAKQKQDGGDMLTASNLYCHVLEARLDAYQAKLDNPELGKPAAPPTQIAAPQIADKPSFTTVLEKRRLLRERAEVQAKQANALAALNDDYSRTTGIANPLFPGNASTPDANGKLRPRGSDGQFQIVSVGPQRGVFKLVRRHGVDVYTNTYEVDAGTGGNVRLAIIRKMIELIRQDFPNEFDFNSSRLGKRVHLSSNPKDNDALQAFLMQEMFSDSVESAGHKD